MHDPLEAFREWAKPLGYPLEVASRERVAEDATAVYDNCFTDYAWKAFLAGWRLSQRRSAD